MLLLFCQLLAQLLDLSVCLQQLFGALTGHGLGLFLEHGQRPQQGLGRAAHAGSGPGDSSDISPQTAARPGKPTALSTVRLGSMFMNSMVPSCRALPVEDVVAEPLV